MARLGRMFGLFKGQKHDSGEEPGHIAAERTQLPLNQHMTMLMAQELPLLDSVDRVRVYEILREYDGPEITSQEELPTEIRQMMDL